MADEFVYNSSVEEQRSEDIFINRKQVYILDNQNGVYSNSEIVFDSSSTSNSGLFADFKNASIILKSYNKVIKLTDTEISLIYYLMASKLCISVCNSAFSRAKNQTFTNRLESGLSHIHIRTYIYIYRYISYS